MLYALDLFEYILLSVIKNKNIKSKNSQHVDVTGSLREKSVDFVIFTLDKFYVCV